MSARSPIARPPPSDAAAPPHRGHQAGAADASRDLEAHRRQLGGQVVTGAVLDEAGLGDLVQVVPPATEPVRQGLVRRVHPPRVAEARALTPSRRRRGP